MADTIGDVCAICLGGMARGQASFTAECSHAFHLSCISTSVAHGNHDCPLCKATWTVLPAVNAPPFVFPPRAPPRPARVPYQDDEPVEDRPAQSQSAGATTDGSTAALVLTTHCEYPAVARDASRENMAVLLHAKAPAAAADAARAPLDLLTVLDVSGSMSGSKLALLKEAMGFVIDNLCPADRLSVVSFSSDARRVTRLARMTDAGKAAAKLAVESLVANGATNIGKGLRVADRVLRGRRSKNAVTSIILLSDGQDTFVGRGRYMDLLPQAAVPVHTFGFGTDHDAAAMHTVAEATGGTFSFIENQAVVQDSFAQCIGGLLSVAAQDARIAVACVHAGVRVREVKSGRYSSSVDADGRAASIDVGELYAEEERRFLLLVDVPRAEASDDATQLLKVSCTYRDTATGRAAEVAGDDAVVQRPAAEAADAQPSMEVERERVRVAATEDIAAARRAADRGEHAEAASILDRRLEAVERSAPGTAGDPTCEALAEELRDLSARVGDRREYQQTGRACLLAGMSSHGQQRASAMELESMCIGRGRAASDDDGEDLECGDDDDSDGGGEKRPLYRCGAIGTKRSGMTMRRAYATPTMARMVRMSCEQRQTKRAKRSQESSQKKD